jgi:hypothetical protein
LLLHPLRRPLPLFLSALPPATPKPQAAVSMKASQHALDRRVMAVQKAMVKLSGRTKLRLGKSHPHQPARIAELMQYWHRRAAGKSLQA